MEGEIYLTERNSRLELIDLEKIHKVINWASEGLLEFSVSAVNSVYGYCYRCGLSFFQQFHPPVAYPEIQFINVTKDNFLKQVAYKFIPSQNSDFLIKIIFILFFLIARFNTPLYNERIPFYG